MTTTFHLFILIFVSIIVLISREVNLLQLMEPAETGETEGGEAREAEAEIEQDAEGEADLPGAEEEKEGLEDINKDQKRENKILKTKPKEI